MGDFTKTDCNASGDDSEAVNSPNTTAKRVTTSPEASSTASDSPTPTNSVHEKNWSSNWQSFVCEEQRQLLGTEEESSDRQSEGEGDVWEMSAEQKDYYRTQFATLQSDASALIPGPVARAFFEKSRLPLTELRKIWQLSDLTKDGALSLEEFSIAMHLVVLRRNHIPLPDRLPPALAPNSPISIISSASPHHGKQWTKFVESPTSSVSSPGPKPVNFDFHKSAVEQDPKILHPVALRVTPGAGGGQEELSSSADVSPIRPIQRPQPKKHTVASGPGSIPPPPPQTSSEESQVVTKKDPPPPPPPRPCKQHTRSSSLDLTRLGRVGAGSLNMPPVPPPRTSPGAMSPKKQVSMPPQVNMDERDAAFANFAQFPEETTTGLTMGAFHVYKKPEKLEDWTPIEDIPLDACVEAREAHNAALRKICHQLQSILASLQEERASLQNILDHLLCH